MNQEEINEVWRKHRKRRNQAGFSGEPKLKEVDGKVTKEECIKLYVTEKKPEDQIRKKDIVPKLINGVQTDVKAIGEMKALNSFRPAKSGYSAIYEGGTACTLGWFAKDLTDGATVIIANNHCTANENKLGPGHPYLCPSPMDGGTITDKLGELKRFIPLKFEAYQCFVRSVFGLRTRLTSFLRDIGSLQQEWNKVDLGIVTVDPNDISIEVHQIGKLNGKRRGQLNELAKKMGRTTGYTENGKLIDNDYYGQVTYSRGTAPFGPCGLLEKTNFSAGGDSSSAIAWIIDNFFAGLLFAGSDTHTLFCHQDFIETEGQLELVW